eukprot:COSAG05_NODE_1488_length_4726_cov_9.016641_2_plen_57_part_00
MLSCAEVTNPKKLLEAAMNQALFDNAASVVRPAEYASRFLAFAENDVFGWCEELAV